MIAFSFSVSAENPGFKKKELLDIWFLGIGAAIASAVLTDYLSKKRPKFLVISGFAGALHPRIRVGETFLCDNVSDLHMIQILLKKGWIPPPTAKLYTTEKLVATAVEKAHLRKTTGMDLVDMETQALFKVAQSYSVPTITIRAVSDAATIDFPIPESILYDKRHQRPRPISLCAHLATNPQCIPDFIRLLKHIAQARAQLKRHLLTLVQAIGRINTAS